ncbi:glycosyltransferase [Providencia rettgeri]|uniref:glycosyltransferase n=1 Tax=Providencia rettgeri TaxID=587 RepID=UPI0039F64387
MNKKVIAIVVTYNRKELLRKVVDSLMSQTYPLDKIIIIDNNSNDGTKDIISPFVNESFIYHNTGGNLGGAGGFYEGFIKASNFDYDYLWLMDDDFSPNNDCLAELVKSNQGGITQPIRYNLDGSCAELSPLNYDLQSFFKIKPKGMSIKEYFSINGPITKPINIEAIPFEGPLIHKNVINHIGYPEPNFFIFCDDIDYAIRAKKHNFSIQCIPDAKAFRLLVNNQKNDLLSWKGYFMLRNLFHLYKKHGNNFFVRNKPIVLTLGYFSICVLKLQLRQSVIILNAYKDSFSLKNNDKYKP